MRETRILVNGHEELRDAHFTHDSAKVYALSGKDSIVFWNIREGKQIWKVDGFRNGDLVGVVMSGDGEYLYPMEKDSDILSGSKGVIWKLNVRTEEKPKYFEFPIPYGYQMDDFLISRQRRFVVTKMGGITICELEIEKNICVIPENGYTVWGFTPDDKSILVSKELDNGNRILYLIKVKTGEIMQQFVGHEGCITDAVISDDGKTLLTVSKESCLGVIWDIESGEIISKYTDIPDDICFARFSPDGTSVFFVGDWISIYSRRPLKELIDTASHQMKDNPLSDEDKRKFYLL